MPVERHERVGSLVDGRYRILAAMAEGSMGVVYRAERVPVGKAVAIKFLHASFASDPEFLGRFERETRVMSKLAHPHCVSVLDFGVSEGAPYLVMDFVAGQTLRQLLDEEPLPPVRALGLMRQILAGLAHAHAQGIVHRDIKPANIMVTEEIGTGAHVRILDFGLARLRGAISSSATQSMVIVGTPSYMAPEQTVGGAVDARADIYAAGVVLFEMVTGRKPFAADDAFDLLGMHRGAPIPRIADLLPEGTAIPPGLQAMIDKAMAKEPAGRYQSAIEFADAIDADTPPVGVRRLSSASLRIEPEEVHDATAVDTSQAQTREAAAAPARRSRGPAIAVVLALVGGVGLAAALLGRGGGETPAAAVARDAGTADAPAVAVAAPVPDATPVIEAVDAAIAIDAPLDAGDGDAASADGDAALDDAGTAVAAEEPEPADPTKVEDPDPAAGTTVAEDEADDAPADTAAALARTPVAPSPAQATTIAGAVKLIKEGQRGLALASLRTLARSNPRSAYIPFLEGNLYFDQRWWSVAMDHYRLAISRNGAYRGNPILIRNVIRTLASGKTRGKAIYFLRRTIGRPAAPYLRAAAAHDPNATVRKQAAALARVIR